MIPKVENRHSTGSVIATAYGANALRARLRDDRIRYSFAERARKYGLVSFGPAQRLRRVTVLVNRESGGRRAADLFKRNALPLLNLAGLQVNVVEVGPIFTFHFSLF
ncbi:hypothetical protein niasHT_016060 [Heterodera trifolii]|uniref:Uncharacterized protein n=1 Tax=Heterodera trifolii TaxID=157864 RepID=A0ABD2LFA3_9BILA